MATNRSRRLRKKLCVDEFQELGFELNLNFREGLSDAELDAFVEKRFGRNLCTTCLSQNLNLLRHQSSAWVNLWPPLALADD